MNHFEPADQNETVRQDRHFTRKCRPPLKVARVFSAIFKEAGCLVMGFFGGRSETTFSPVSLVQITAPTIPEHKIAVV